MNHDHIVAMPLSAAQLAWVQKQGWIPLILTALNCSASGFEVQLSTFGDKVMIPLTAVAYPAGQTFISS